MAEQKYYTVQDLVEMLKLHENTILRMLEDGRIKGFKIGKSWRVTSDNLPGTPEARP